MSDDPRLDPHYDARLSELISDAVDDVEPGDGLPTIRSRTRKETKMNSSRNWLYAVGGAVAGTAAVIVAIAVVSSLNDDGDGSTPAASSTTATSGQESEQPSASDTPSDSPTPSESASESATLPAESPVAVYFAGEGPQGTVLFREFQPGTGGDPVSSAANLAVAGAPLDPDYRTLWPGGSSATASYDGDVITVDLKGTNLHDRPQGMSESDAGLALQQVIYSVQGAVQKRAPVQFLVDGQHTDQVLGEPASEPLSEAKALATLSLMSITSPEEGQTVSGTFTASGVNNSFEATVSYEIRDGRKVIDTGYGTASGWGEDKLFPWELEVDVTKLQPGTYTFVAMNDDPSGGAEGHGPDVDTKTIVVQ